MTHWLEHCRSFIDAVGDQMIVVGDDYRILAVNRSFLDSSGMVDAEIVGRRCYEVTHRSPRPCDQNGDACPLTAVLTTEQTTKVTHEHFSASGRRCVVDIVGSPVRGPEGNVVGLLESIRDVTVQKELEEALIQRNAELEEARRNRAQFTSTVCHELKNVVNAMGLQAELLRRSPTLDRTRERAAVIIAETKQLGRLVEDMRDASAIETQRFTLRPSPCDMASIVRQTADTYRHVSEVHDIEIRVADGAVMGVWDAERLRQVLDNLLSNAIKYSPEGGEIRVTLERSDADVEITITDRGLGMTDEQADRIFEPYTRAHTGIGGVGLGLFVARGIVEAHGGTIHVTSAVGVGTTFFVRIPVDDRTGDDQRRD